MYKKGRVNSNSRIISTDEDPSLRIESSAIINLRGVSTKLNKYIVFTMQTYKKLKILLLTVYTIIHIGDKLVDNLCFTSVYCTSSQVNVVTLCQVLKYACYS